MLTLVKWKDRIKICFIIINVVFFILIIRLFQLHLFVEYSFEPNPYKKYLLRGNIYSRNFEELAVSIKRFSLGVHPHLYPFPKELVDILAELTNSSTEELNAKLKNSKEKKFIWLQPRKFLSYTEAEETKRILKKYSRYVEIVGEYERIYPKGSLAAHTIGLVATNKDGIEEGIEGIEKYCDNLLKSEHYIAPGYTDAYGNIFLASLPTGKKNFCIQLTIDEYLQALLEEELKKKEFEWACGIILDPSSGEILALANLPCYNPNNRRSITSENKKNRAVSDLYEPGSTFKLFTAAAILEENPNIEDVKLVCFGEKNFGRRFIHCVHKHNEISFSEILEKSCNIGIGELLIENIKPYKFIEYIRKFGFLEKTGIALPGEAKGFLCTSVDNLEEDVATYATLAFGQGIAITPLQLALATAALVNGGILYRPKLIKAIITEEGRIYKVKDAELKRRVISEETSKRLADITRNVVDFGTGKKAKIQNYAIGGKTGTAEKLTHPQYYIASFVGWFPYYKPSILITIVVGNPKDKIYYGGEVAAPIFQSILRGALVYLNLIPNESISFINHR